MYFVTLQVEADSLHEADKIAEAISDTVEAPIAGVYPEHNVEYDNDGQVVIYTGSMASPT